MVSFWPWKGDDSSPASFEKALSALSAKIQKASIKLDSLRQRSRRFTVLWTLYAGFAYLLCTIILALVVGWQNWGWAEYVTVIGGPLVIYLVRLGLATYYGYRTSSVQAHIDDLTRQRDGTIEKLKAATKFNSTQELLKKYGGSPTPKPKPTGTPDRKTTPKQGMQKEARTSFVPPPTANIPGRDRPLNDSSPLMSPTPAGQSSRQQVPMSPLRVPQSAEAPGSPVDVSAEFAPNAYSAPPQYAQMNEGSRWYDKILDVLLGEDETRPGARIALICHQCRLVNGQAPPGVKHLEDLGKWRCCGCGALNGEESEVTKIVSSIKEASQETPRIDEGDQRRKVPKSNSREQGNAQIPALDGHDSDVTEDSTQNSEDSDALPRKEMMEVTKSRESPAAETDATRRRSTRSTKGKKAG